MKVVNILGQFWSAENLSVSHYRNGDPIPEVRDQEEWVNLKTGAWCHYNNDPLNEFIHGKIYNWYAVTDSRGLAPQGFRVPTHYDWFKLEENIGGDGRRLRYHRAWIGSNEELGPQYSHFNARPSGLRLQGRFDYSTPVIGWWTFPDLRINKPQFHPIAHLLYGDESKILWKPFFKNDGFYVRCLKEEFKTIKLYFDDELMVFEAGITLKYSEHMTFQNFLNHIYSKYLTQIVPPYSYGRKWIIEKFDGGGRLEMVQKRYGKDYRKIEDVFSELKDLFSDTIYIVTVPKNI